MVKESKKDKLKILVVTYDYYPDDSPNTYRWKNVLRAWAEREDAEIFVVCASKGNLLDFELVDGVKIYRTGRSLFEKVKSKILKHSLTPSGAPSKADPVIAQEGLIRKIYNRTWKKLYFPDYAFLWLSPAMKMAEKLIESENITNLITVSWPFTDHVVGYKLKQKYNIQWIADTIDPFYLSKALNNTALYDAKSYKLENKILKKADVITVLTDKLKEKYGELYPAVADKIVVNHNLFVPVEVPEKSTKSKKIKLVFVGTVVPVVRSPEYLLELFNNLVNLKQDGCELELHFYGNTTQCNDVFAKYDFLLNKSLFIHGMTSRENIPGILSEASVLVNIGNSNTYQEPSKIIEYIYLGKPILNVCSITEDSSKEALAKYPLHFNIYKDEINDQLKLEELFGFFKNDKSLNRDVIMKIIWKYLLPQVEQNYFNLLEKKQKL
ncbi:hypothetical protein AY601_4541 [Pedobacter cryoconitis]|uniref:Glycosyltransferase involved in cell wall biosynthesis n=1 Tax=Pedobacter cryoconitis TaxID=188932 RepID=A0A127VKF0_9SPHI|nr:hypothetical protein [Pedobacter cryoconitis]AMQ01379.1 hypothetical protein AY601_4541 [Pedobacter cryoconitis]